MNKKIQIAKKLYEDMRQCETHLRAWRRYTIALPKAKKEKYDMKHAGLLVKYKNAQSKFQSAVKKLNAAEFNELHEAVYL